MKLSLDAVLTFVKGIAGILSAIGIAVSPEDAAAIGSGFFVLYGVVQSIRSYIKGRIAGDAL